ncbi:MAG TPA: hypothetical protein VF331_21700 [Polyangiales bacterium]
MTEPPTRPDATPAGAAARCAIHPDVVAYATCSRCGNYTCERCREAQSTTLCLSCRVRTAAAGPFPYSRDHWSLDGLISLSLSRWKQHWGLFVLLSGAGLCLVYGSMFAFILFSTRAPSVGRGWLALALHQAAPQVVTSVLQLCMELSLFGLSLDVLEGRPASLVAALARLRRLPEALLQLCITYAAFGALLGAFGLAAWKAGASQLWFVGLVALVAAPPTVYVGLGFVFAQISLVADPNATAWSAMRSSWTIVSGRRWAVLGVSVVAGIFACLGLFACGVGFVASLPLGTLLYSALFLALKTETTADRNVFASPQWPL